LEISQFIGNPDYSNEKIMFTGNKVYRGELEVSFFVAERGHLPETAKNQKVVAPVD
jgi:hypothetical protein